jgi:endonuclease YncB( thermonuclease family)
MKAALSLLFALAMATSATAQSVVDGDTIRIGAARFRLWGIDAPEARQTCADGWQAGAAASRALGAFMEGRAITCEPRGQDRYGRTIALCRADGRDLGAEMVRAGMALAFTRYSADYVSDEAKAKAAGVGVHAHACAPPWEWRAAQHKPN